MSSSTKTFMEFETALQEINAIVELAQITGYYTFSKPTEDSVFQKSFTDAYTSVADKSSAPRDMETHCVNTTGHSLRGFLMALDYDAHVEKKTGDKGMLFLILVADILKDIKKDIQPLADNQISRQFVIDYAGLLTKYANEYSAKK